MAAAFVAAGDDIVMTPAALRRTLIPVARLPLEAEPGEVAGGEEINA